MLQELLRSIIIRGLMMNYIKYYEQLGNMAEPVLPNQLPKIKINLSALSNYARQKGIPVSQLSEKEKAQFISKD